MRKLLMALVVAAMVVGGSAGCSSGPPPKPKRGTLPPGTAHLSVDGGDLRTTDAVVCTDIAWSTTITTGDEATGATVMVSSAKKLLVESVQIHNLNHFTGNYNRDLNGDASIAMVDATYHITGDAMGYEPTSIAPITRPFDITVAC